MNKSMNQNNLQPSNQPDIQNEPENPTLVDPTFKQPKIRPIIIVLVALLLVYPVIVLAKSLTNSSFNKQYPPVPVLITPPPTESVTPTTSLEDFSNWKTYVSKDNKISFKYPADLFLADKGINYLLFFPDENVAKCVQNNSTNWLGKCGNGSNDMVLNIGISNELDSLKNLKTVVLTDNIGRKWTIYGPEEVDGAFNLIAQITPTIQNYEIGIQCGVTGFEKYFNDDLVVDLGNGKYDSSKMINKQLELSKQILSTFKFLDQPEVECRSCPQFSPPSKDWCRDGKVLPPKKNWQTENGVSCYCYGPPICDPLQQTLN